MALVPYSIPDQYAMIEEVITTQFKDRPVVSKYLRLWIEEVLELFVTFQSLAQDRDIDSATGDVLDIIGRIVGQERTIVGGDLYDFFGFRGHLQALGFGDTYVEGVGGVWWSFGAPMGGDVTMTDEQYRLAIKARIMRNTSRGTPEDTLKYIRFVFGVNGRFTWNEGGVARVGVGRKLSNFEKALIAAEFSFQKYPTYYSPKPLGVALELYEYDSVGTLGFVGTPSAKGMISLSTPNPDGGIFASIKYFEEVPANPPAYEWDSAAGDILPGYMGFTRASTATYWSNDGTIKSAAVDTPRMCFDPQSLLFSGLLLEESRENRVLHSTDMRNAVWSGMAMTAETEVTIDGTTVAGLEKTGAWQSRQQYVWTPAGDIAYSFYVRNKTRDGKASFSVLSVDGSATYYQVVVDTLTGDADVRANTGNATTTVTPIAGGVYVSVGLSIPSDGVGLVFYPGDFAADGGGEISFFSCHQLESAKESSSYIPTQDTTVVRSADICHSTALTLPLDGFSFYVGAIKNSTKAGIPIAFTDTSSAFVGVTDSGSFRVLGSTEGERTSRGDASTIGVLSRVAACASNSNPLNRMAIDGKLLADQVNTLPSVNLGSRNILKLGGSGATVEGLWVINKFSIFTDALTSDQLNYLTYAQ